jgi:hypothetical protein
MATRRTDIAGNTDVRERPDGYRTRRSFTETRPGYSTTEFMVMVVAIAGILIATYWSDADLGANEGWKYATWVAVAYILSRGLAKAGTREPHRGDSDGH